MADNEELRRAISTLAPFIFIQTDEEGQCLKWIQREFGPKKRHSFRCWNPTLGLKTLQEYTQLWEQFNQQTLRMDTATSDANGFLSRVLADATPDGRLYTIFLGATNTLLSGRDPMLDRRLTDIAVQLQMNRQSFKSLIFIGNTLQIPANLERMFKVCYFDLPTVEEHRKMLDEILSSDHLSKRLTAPVDVASVAVSMSGMTHYEAEQTALAALGLYKNLSAEHVRNAKREAINKNPLLTLVNPKMSFADIGGMSRLKQYLMERNGSWGEEGKSYGLPRFRGVLQVGLPGNGKSLSCKAIGREYGLPVIQFDPGKVFGGQVGQSEGNMRKALKTMEAMAPCVVWIDEIEKGLAGMHSSSFSDSGTTARVIGTFLNWMQECEADVILMATANNIVDLPPELLRRFDEIFFVGLPGRDQRREIWEIQIRAKGRDPKNFDLDELIAESNQRSGSEIETAVNAAMFTAFSDKRREMTSADLVKAVKTKPPLLVTMREQLTSIIDWVGKDPQTSDGIRARFAHALENEVEMEVV